MNAIYLYQECGTPIDEYTVDNTQRQQAYVQWIAVSETELDGNPDEYDPLHNNQTSDEGVSEQDLAAN